MRLAAQVPTIAIEYHIARHPPTVTYDRYIQAIVANQAAIFIVPSALVGSATPRRRFALPHRAATDGSQKAVQTVDIRAAGEHRTCRKYVAGARGNHTSATGCCGTARRMLRVNVLPSPNRLSQVMRAPINSASICDKCRPSPVPS